MRQLLLNITLLITCLFVAVAARALDANFTVDYMSGCAPLVVHFTNTSTGATSYDWDLGNGTTSTLPSVSGSYLDPGTYTVTLTAHNGAAVSTHTVTITVYASPVVSFTANDTSVCPGTAVTFTNTSAPGVPGSVTCLWNFGDGFTSTSGAPTHVYNTPGYYNVTLSVTNSQGCVTTRTIGAYIHVFSKPVPLFAASPVYYCEAPANVLFTNSSTGTAPFTYYWTFGDGGTSTAINPTHTYLTTGTYTVKLKVTDANGCSDTITRLNYVYVGNMTASFTGPTTACVFNGVTFPNTSSPHSSSSWNYGDGSYGTSDTGSHIYSTPGTYNVTLIIFNGFCYDTVVRPITILPQPTGSFTMSPVVACPAPATITFTGTVPAGSTVSWYYGDGGTGTGATSTHTYTANGNYTVSMVITNANGCKDTIVNDYLLSNLQLTARPLVPLCGCGCAPLTVNFGADIAMSVPTGGPYPVPVSSYTWNFGDGSPVVTGTATPSHIFTAVGIYSVICTVVTANGCTKSDTSIVSVGTPPVVTFTAAPTHMCYKRPVVFNAHIITGPVDQYFWDWGDGATTIDTFATTSHTFINPGLFTVTLIASYHGCNSAPYVWTDSFRVDSPKAIIGSAYHCDPYRRVTFEDLSMGNDAPYWIFGDGTFSTSDTPNHTFPTNAIYTTLLCTYNAASGCRDTTSVTLNLIPPVPAMTASDTAICIGDTVHFVPVITGGTAIQNFWDVNGVTLDWDTAANFNYWFPLPGIYSIRYRMRDAHGCFDTAQRANWIIAAKPDAGFSAVPLSGCGPLAVNFTDMSTGVTGTYMTNYRWTFGDISSTSLVTTTSSTVTHIYTNAGTYSVQEIVTDNIGCKDTLIQPNLIQVWRPKAIFTATNTYPCLNVSTHFNNTSTGGVVSSLWSFGDGDTSTAANPDHTYTSLGVYTIRLIVTDAHGCRDTAVYTGYITVSKPNANFYMDDSFSICSPFPVHFINTTTGGAFYNWDFDDGGTSVSMSPGNLYTAPGVYTVTMVATDIHGCKDTAYGHATVFGSAGAFSYTPLSGCAPLRVHFDAALSNVPNVIWDFADGTTSPTSTSDTISHYYTLPGAYVPKLILSDNSGCQSSSLGLDTIKVNAVYGGYTTDPFPVCINDNVTFVDTSRSYYSTITEWHWGYGPGDSAFIAGPVRLYNTVGSFPVTLIVKDGWGCTGSVTKNVVVNPLPVVTASPDTTVCVGDQATLSGYGAVTYNWAPAPVSCTPCQTTQVTPTAVTTYTVTGVDANGCKNTDTVTVYLRTHTISEGWGDTEVCRHVPVPLFDTGGTKYTWIPAAGLSNATIYNPIATPSVTTTYTVIAQLAGCIPDTNFVTVIVHQLPTIDAGPDQRLVAGSHAQINATGTLIESIWWMPGESLSCDTCMSTVANNLNTQTYVATVTSDFGCKDQDTVTIFLFCDESQIFIPNTFTPNGDGQNDVFYPRGSGVRKVNAFRVYNRWGELLFEKNNFMVNDVSKAWDGTFNGGGARPDVYVWLLDAECDTGEPFFMKGDVTIVR